MSTVITPHLAGLFAAIGADKHEGIRALAAVVAGAGRGSDADGLAEVTA